MAIKLSDGLRDITQYQAITILQWLLIAAGVVLLAIELILPFGRDLNTIIASIIAILVLVPNLYLHLRRWPYSDLLLIIFLAVLVGVFSVIDGTEKTASLAILLPPAIAAVVSNRRSSIWLSAAVTLVIILWRAGWHGAYADPTTLVLLLVIISCLDLARLVLETSKHDNVRQYERGENLKNRLITILSHETQTPLSEIVVTSDLLQDNRLSELTKTQKEMVANISQSAKEAVGRIQDMQTLIGYQDGQVRLDKQAGLFSELIESVLAEHDRQFKRKGLTVNFVPAVLPPITMDIAKMRRVFDSLIENAIIYTGDGGTITVHVKENNGLIRAEFTDTGIGVPAAERGNLFQSFYRASNAYTASPDGQGIGLTLAKIIVEDHGGQIGFTSQEGKGSTFWIEIPATS